MIEYEGFDMLIFKIFNFNKQDTSITQKKEYSI